MYIKRDHNGEIALVSRVPTADCDEPIAANAPELLAFLGQDHSELQQLRNSDLEFVRVLEDVVELLISKGVISFTELPEAARDKWMSRQSLRRQANSVDLIGDDEEGLI